MELPEIPTSRPLHVIGFASALAKAAVAGPQVSWRPKDYRDRLEFPDDAANIEVLDLSHKDLKQFPWEIAKFKELRVLELAGNPLSSVPDVPGLVLDWEVFEKLKRYISPDHVVGIRMAAGSTGLPARLAKLKNLTKLTLEVRGDKPPAGIGRLRSLTMLEMDARGLSTFPTDIRELHELSTLRLNARIPAVPEWLGSLTSLRELALYDNPLGRVPLPIRHLKNLRYLNLSATGIDGLPEWIDELHHLEVLWLSNNEISRLPDAIGNIGKLTALVILNNRIEDLPSAFGNLKNLRALSLGETDLRSIPEAVFSLSALEALDISAREDSPGLLSVIPERILDLEKLRILETIGQPIETPPLEVVTGGIDAIRAYYRQLGEGKDYLCEAKLLIVGEPGAGKTSLAKKIENSAYELKDDEKSTEGIDVIRWSFPTHLHVDEDGTPTAVARDFNVNAWDFGGQEIYHATHQFFLTKRSLYVLVADSRKEDTDFQYWLSVVELLSDGSPLIVVKNEKQDRRRDINESRIRGRFPNLRSVLTTNLATNRGLEEVRRVVRQELERLPHIGSPLPRTWRRVREALERDARDYIELADYLDICGKRGFTREDDMLQLSGYLHDLGVCLHFQDDALLRKTVILKPGWATDAVYRVLDSKRVIDQHGRFTSVDLSDIWSERRYAPMRDELVQLMIKFQLCYRLGEGVFLAPQLLESTPPTYAWDTRDNLVVRYEYDFMPKGILTRFIVATHFLIPREDWLWRDGVVLERDGARAEVIEDYPQRRITVRLAGPEKQNLLAVIDHELDRIHRSYPRLKMRKLIPCGCARCAEQRDPHFYPYDVLLRFAWDGQRIQCPESYTMVDGRSLIAAVFPQLLSKPTFADGTAAVSGTVASELPTPAREPHKEVFVSYAWGGESDAIVDRLEQTLRERGVTIVRDRSDMRYKDSIGDFMRRIGRGKCIVVVLSKKYIESKSCMFELTQIASRGDLRDRLFPIVLTDAELDSAVRRVEYVKLWESRIKELNGALKEVNQEDLEGIREELDLYAQIRRTITQLMKILADMNAFTPQSHLDTGFEALTSAITAQLER